jgi:uncharacterized membrane protein YkvA (DUF1232 family)
MKMPSRMKVVKKGMTSSMTRMKKMMKKMKKMKKMVLRWWWLRCHRLASRRNRLPHWFLAFYSL